MLPWLDDDDHHVKGRGRENCFTFTHSLRLNTLNFRLRFFEPFIPKQLSSSLYARCSFHCPRPHKREAIPKKSFIFFFSRGFFLFLTSSFLSSFFQYSAFASSSNLICAAIFSEFSSYFKSFRAWKFFPSNRYARWWFIRLAGVAFEFHFTRLFNAFTFMFIRAISSTLCVKETQGRTEKIIIFFNFQIEHFFTSLDYFNATEATRQQRDLND